MDPISEEERNHILSCPPRGTWALMIGVGIAMLVFWLFLYFGVFLPRGVVS